MLQLLVAYQVHGTGFLNLGIWGTLVHVTWRCFFLAVGWSQVVQRKGYSSLRSRTPPCFYFFCSCVETWRGCRFISSLVGALGKLPGGLGSWSHVQTSSFRMRTMF